MSYTVHPLAVYVVAWDERRIIKAGVTARQRWRAFTLRGARLVAVAIHERAWELEIDLAAFLAFQGSPAFATALEAQSLLGNRGGGYTECVRFDAEDDYRYALTQCPSIMREHAPEQCGNDLPALMHGRTDGRTYVDPHSPTRPPLVSDAHAHIREMAVDKWGDR